MNFTDFSQLGGTPIDGGVLTWNHATLAAHLSAYYRGGGTTPLIISGMTSGGLVLSAGYCVIDGELLEFRESAIPSLGPGMTLYVRIFEERQPAVMQDGSTKNVWEVTRYTTLSTVSGTPFDEFKTWHEVVLGPRSRTPWALFYSSVSGDILGTVYYRKDVLANTVQLRGSLTVLGTLFSSGETTSPLYRPIGAALPAGYRPEVVTPFTAFRRYHGGNVLDAGGVININQINAEIRTDGTIAFGFLKPDAGVSSYTVSFNQIIPLL